MWTRPQQSRRKGDRTGPGVNCREERVSGEGSPFAQVKLTRQWPSGNTLHETTARRTTQLCGACGGSNTWPPSVNPDGGAP